MFGTLRNGALFYALDKSDKISLKVGQVESVAPTPKTLMSAYNPEQTVDITVKFGTETAAFKQLPYNLSIANTGANGIVVSDSREMMSGEVEGMMRTSQGMLDSIPYHQGVLEKAELILKELNPQYAKERNQEEKIGALETKMNAIEGSIEDIKVMLAKSLKSSD